MAQRKTIRELLVRLGVVSDVEAVEDYDKAIGSVKSGMAAAAKVATAMAAAIAAGGAVLFREARQVAEYGDEIAKAAQRVGIGVEAFQELKKGAELSGAEVSDVETGMRRLSDTVAEAISGSKEQAEALAAIGLRARDLKGLQMEEIFELVADGLLTLEEGYERTAAAQEIFGRGGGRLLPLLNQGAEGIREYRRQARELGIVLSKEQAAASEEFIDRLADTKDILSGLRRTIGLALMPVITDLLTGFREWYLTGGQLIRQRLEGWADRLALAVRDLGGWIGRVDETVRRLIGWGPILKAAFSAATLLAFLAAGAKLRTFVTTLVQALGPVLAVLAGFTIPELLAVLAALAAAFIAVYVVVDDLVTFIRGGDSAIGAFIDRVRGGSEVLAKFRELGAALVDLFVELRPFVEVAGEALRAMLQVTISLMATLAGQTAPELSSALDVVIYAVQALTDWLDRANDGLDSMAGRIQKVQAAAQRLFDSEAFQAAAGVLDLASEAASGVTARTVGAGGLAAGAGLVGSVVAGARSTGSTSSTTNIGGDTNTVTVSGTSDAAADVEEVLRRRDRAKARRIAAATVGAEI